MILAAVLLAALTPTPESIDATLVSSTGEVTKQSLPLTTAGRDSDVSHAWAWTGTTAPLRITPAELENLDALRERLALETAKIEVRIARRKDDVTLVAAPVAMWEEVPEELLPTYKVRGSRLEVPVAASHASRLRAFSETASSVWTTAAPRRRSVELALHPAADVAVEVDAAKPSMQLLESGTALRRPGVLARFAGKGSSIQIRSAPPMASTITLIEAAGYAASTFSGALSDLPPRVSLKKGATVRARFVTTDGKPVSAQGTAEWWASGSVAHTIRRSASSDGSGAWSIAGVPEGDLSVVIDDQRFARVQRNAVSTGDTLDLGEIVLKPPRAMTLAVMDGDRPVRDAAVTVAGHEELRTGARGIATIEGLDRDSPLRLRVTAAGYMPLMKTIAPPLPSQEKVALLPSVRVRGELEDEAGLPLSATLRIISGTRESDAGTVQGPFELDLAPKAEHEIVFSAPDRRELRVAVPAGAAREIRNLGRLQLSRGVTVSGTILSSEDLQPVGGASVWTLRATASMMGRTSGDRIETETKTDGTFQLSGGDPIPAVLRVDAPGYARSYRSVDPRDGVADAGTIYLQKGATVRVETDDAGVARLDLRGDGNETDILSAAARDGVALFRHVPAGSVHLEVWSGASIVCEKTVEIPGDKEQVDVGCAKTLPIVRGTVRVAGRGEAGLLQWERLTRSTESLIVGHATPGGLVQQQVVGRSPAPVTVPVTPAGEFTTREIGEGRWRVRWLPDSGGSAGARDVMISGAAEQTVTLEYGAQRIRGVVVAADDTPAALATVVVTGSMASTITDDQGRFSIAGLEPGRHVLRARRRNQASAEVTVTVEPLHDADDVRLRLDRDAVSEVTVTVLAAGGEPAAGAFVVLETDGGLRRIATANSTGQATFAIPPGAGQQRRAAASFMGGWRFGNWTTGEALMLRGQATGNLTIQTKTSNALAQIRGENGWDLTAILASLGTSLMVTPDRPLVLSGVETGGWTVRVGSCQQFASVKSGSVARIDCP